jgi:pimeloyl-ACP methyl ester carboxylesterase
MNPHLTKNLEKLLLSVFAFLLFINFSTAAEPVITVQSTTGTGQDSTVFQITLRGDTYPFDHADYGLYIPEDETIRGVLVLQHGCGMEQFGITRPYDIQYQSFARKWHLAILETALYGNCSEWKDAHSGSADALLKALDELGKLSGHTELSQAPWLLWGHSGGGYWVLSMIQAFPERTLAAFCYSPAWEIPNGKFPSTVKDIPVFIRHAGAGEAPNGGANCCWASSAGAFNALRELDAPASVAYTAGQNHNFSFVRYMAIPFYEAALKQRLPTGIQTALKPLDRNLSWLGDTLTHAVFKESTYTGKKETLCLLPDSITAAKWQEYVNTGNVADNTPPPAPYDLQVKWVKDSVELSWKADADIESGIKRFNIYRNGIHIGRFPASGIYQTFDTNGDNTIPKMLPGMQFRIAMTEFDAPAAMTQAIISIRTVNNFDWESEEAKILLDFHMLKSQ